MRKIQEDIYKNDTKTEVCLNLHFLKILNSFLYKIPGLSRSNFNVDILQPI